MAGHIGLSTLMVIFGSLVCLEIECVQCASYTQVKDPKLDMNLKRLVSRSDPVQVQDVNSTLCCSNSSCIYDMVVERMRSSQGFKSLTNILFMSGERFPDFILMDVRVIWKEYNSSTGTMSNLNNTMQYILGETPVKAVFGPVQDLFQDITSFNPLLVGLALAEEVLVPDELLTASSQKLEAWKVKGKQSITLDISDTCISNSLTLNEPNKALNASVVAVLKQIYLLTTTESSHGNCNKIGHVIRQSDAKYIVIAFIVFFYLAIPFLVFLLLVVNYVIHKPDLNLCKKLLSEDTQKHLFRSTASITWLILFIQVITTTIFFSKYMYIENRKPSFQKEDLDEHSMNISDMILGIVIARFIIITLTTLLLFVLHTSFLIITCVHVRGKYESKYDWGVRYLIRNSIFAVIFFAFTFLWELISLIPHLILFPYHTLAILVQYIGVLFLLNYFVYHALKFCSCSNVIRKGDYHCEEYYNIVCKCVEAPNEYEGKQASEEKKDHTCWDSCNCQSVGHACLSFFSLLFLLSLGFLYFMVVLMGVNTAGVTVVILTSAVTVVTLTVTDAVKWIIKKILHCLKCGEDSKDAPTRADYDQL